MSALQKLKAYFGMVPADDDGYDVEEDYRRGYADDEYDSYEEPAPRSRSRYRDSEDTYDEPVSRARSRSVPGSEPAVHGALAMDRQPEPVARLRPVTEPVVRQPVRDPLSRITTLHPTSYAEARAIGEHYREGIPVIMNLTEMDNADAKRLVDFAAGLAFALRGSMDKVTNKVFLLSPPDVDVTAEDRRRIAEGGLFLRG
ncbi:MULTISPECIES: cell division protein SepF [unclassified Amycolatopsis]|uniref:cell division protein SepF n=1 Tax=unclassified Amycolatopsis TaxID=2618356 RepID=UPI001FF25B5A|nr:MULTISPECIES: cell division protein SepF [unclassified Amycolatopsis]UOZ06181.1 cell division protein SepF [Amycolatopsis sp. WQ 127309]WSJ81795.1 cell division protein SepF [Amycolatopsis sp. NBC_01307]WSK74834.1 cell division protein SepF [Amycolatopsis sp. NBC_01286]